MARKGSGATGLGVVAGLIAALIAFRYWADFRRAVPVPSSSPGLSYSQNGIVQGILRYIEQGNPDPGFISAVAGGPSSADTIPSDPFPGWSI